MKSRLDDSGLGKRLGWEGCHCDVRVDSTVLVTWCVGSTDKGGARVDMFRIVRKKKGTTCKPWQVELQRAHDVKLTNGNSKGGAASTQVAATVVEVPEAAAVDGGVGKSNNRFTQ